ncbi:hypothetical protein V1520DRAFT_347256 [Lipomyces starkeyi]|uniref:Mid2 domain-containing protein n=1 Tax=Lipomyces starkeyi NRRL Y-11557 TaxID=675824 RepID=A0A1E3Q1D9_LIPST|nr:hypothetical protein LIPSTDRAFT_73214 [Lipomyces starkeyi NRRL Y-11557]
MSSSPAPRAVVVILLSLLIFLAHVHAETSSTYTSIITAPPNGITSIPASLVTDDSTPTSAAPVSLYSSSLDAAKSASLLYYSSTLVAESTTAPGPLVTATEPDASSTLDYILPKSTATSKLTSSSSVLSSVSSTSSLSPTSISTDYSSSSSQPSASATNLSDSSSNSASTTSPTSKRRTTILVAVIVSVATVLVMFFLVVATIHYQRRRQRKRLRAGTSQLSGDAEPADTEKQTPSATTLTLANGPRSKDKMSQEMMEVIREESVDFPVPGPSRFGRTLSRNKTLPLLPPATELYTPSMQVFDTPRRNASIDTLAAERHRNAVILNYSDESLLKDTEVDSIGVAR